MSGATERIELSRQRLLAAMTPPPPQPASSGRARRASIDFASRIKALPVISAVVESIDAWWSHHPMRPLGRIAGEASEAIAKPVADRHPIALVMVAAVAGAGLAWARPWRWALRSALFAGLLPQLTSRVVASLPLESWMAMVGTALSSRAPAARPAQGTPKARPEPAVNPAA
jgi:hypothetical protein